MAGKVGRPRRTVPRDVRNSKVPAWMAERVGAIAQLTRRTHDEVWAAVAGAAVDAEFLRVVAAAGRKARKGV